jgi:hypothetical protein
MFFMAAIAAIERRIGNKIAAIGGKVQQTGAGDIFDFKGAGQPKVAATFGCLAA